MVDNVPGVGLVPKEFHGEALRSALAGEPLRLLDGVLLTALVEDDAQRWFEGGVALTRWTSPL